MLLSHCVDWVHPLRGWICCGLSPLRLQGQGQGWRVMLEKLITMGKTTLNTQRIPICWRPYYVRSNVYSATTVDSPSSFTTEEKCWERLGGLSKVTRWWSSTPGFDSRLQPLGICCLWYLLPAQEAPKPKGRRDWRRGVCDACCLLFSCTLTVIHKGILPSIPKECQLFNKSHINRKHRFPDGLLYWPCNGVSPTHLTRLWKSMGLNVGVNYYMGGGALTLVAELSVGSENTPASWVHSWRILGGFRPQHTGAFRKCASCHPRVPMSRHSAGSKGHRSSIPAWAAGRAEKSVLLLRVLSC